MLAALTVMVSPEASRAGPCTRYSAVNTLTQRRARLALRVDTQSRPSVEERTPETATCGAQVPRPARS